MPMSDNKVHSPRLPASGIAGSIAYSPCRSFADAARANGSDSIAEGVKRQTVSTSHGQIRLQFHFWIRAAKRCRSNGSVLDLHGQAFLRRQPEPLAVIRTTVVS